jgi:hypothetical protein
LKRNNYDGFAYRITIIVTTMTTSQSSTAKKVRTRVLRSQGRVWVPADFEGLDAQRGTYSAVANELQRLAKRGELTRLRRGVYWRGEKTRFGMMSAPTGEVLRKISDAGGEVGATGWYATNLLGLSTQVAPVETLATTHRVPRGYEKRAASRAARGGRVDAKLTGLEITLLEALEGWDRYVELDSSRALERFDRLLHSKDVSVSRLAKASRTEPSAVRERLRAILLHAGFEQEARRVRRAPDPRTRERALRVIEGHA